ncbi:MAG: hypothetical protein ACLGHN_01185 [Bacteriovoracia bacterium]
MKKLSLLLATTILMSACSKTVEEVSNSNPTQKTEAIRQEKLNKDLDALKRLLSSEAPNLALAEILIKSLSEEYKPEVAKLVSQLTPHEAEAIINQVKADNRSIYNSMMFKHQRYQDDEALLKNSLMDPDLFMGHPFSFENQLKVSTFAYLKSKALDNIISTYDKRASELADQLAESIAIEIGKSYPVDATKIEDSIQNTSKERAIEVIKNIQPVVEKLDNHFKNSKLSESEQYTVVIAGIIAGGIYAKVKDSNGFQNFLKRNKQAIKDVKEFAEKAKEFSVIVNSLEDHIKKTSDNIRDFQDGLKGSRKSISELYSEAVKNGGPKDLTSKRIINFLYNNVIRGKKEKLKEENDSILSKQVSFNENFDKTLTAAGKLSDNLSNIIKTTNRLTALFGVKPSKDLQNVLDKAQKVSAVVSTVKSAMAGFATGGFIGALGALSSGPMASLMSGGDQTSAQLGEINKKLDQVLRNQREMMRMQVETMNMIKDLALMVDTYHQREMAALSSLKDYAMVDLEIARATLHKDIRSCERIISFQLSSVWRNFSFSQESFHSINNIDLLSSRFNEQIQGIKDIHRILISVESNGFGDCQKALAEAFGSADIKESPLNLVSLTNGEQNFYNFQRKTYRPLLGSLQDVAKSSSLEEVPLHLPMKSFGALKIKDQYVKNTSIEGQHNDVYYLSDLISVKNLERYLNHLIILLPIIEMDKEVWLGSYSDIINTYLRNIDLSRNHKTRSFFLLENALKITQSAIAQEAIIAGEPLLPTLYEKHVHDVFSTATPCGDGFNRRVCAIRTNNLLLQNLLSYTLFREGEGINNFKSRYEKAFASKNVQELTAFLNLKDKQIEVSVDSDQLVLKLKNGFESEVTVNLPSPKDLASGEILYSENMPRLLKMQEVILNNLEKVTPVKRDYHGNDMLKVLMTGVKK